MNVEVKFIKGIPKEQISHFEDRVVYNTAVLTREYTKSRNAFPYLTGKLRRSEAAAPIVGSHKEYGLTAGVDYAKYVWKKKNASWTNPSTQPQWYYTNFSLSTMGIINDAVLRAKKEI